MKTGTQVKTAATLVIALGVGSAVGLSNMVSAASTARADVQATSDAQAAAETQEVVPNEPSSEPGSKVHIDRSGQKQVGKASFYANRYAGKTMADGTPMRLYSNNAASLTLPLGSTARVTNLETGKSAIISIRDRGPYVKGRIVDLSPATAKLIGMSQAQGLAKVEVVPLSMPGVNASPKLARNDR